MQSAGEQYEEADRIGRLLGWSGVRDAMLFDELGSLRVHYKGGRLVEPHPPEPQT